eukprot:15305068-Alexandrium_andersonii.AAC.1
MFTITRVASRIASWAQARAIRLASGLMVPATSSTAGAEGWGEGAREEARACGGTMGPVQAGL